MEYAIEEVLIPTKMLFNLHGYLVETLAGYELDGGGDDELVELIELVNEFLRAAK